MYFLLTSSWLVGTFNNKFSNVILTSIDRIVSLSQETSLDYFGLTSVRPSNQGRTEKLIREGETKGRGGGEY